MLKLHGVHTPHHKNTSSSVPKRIPVPAEVVIPLSMHIGAPAKPLVKPGDEVQVGQPIAEAGGFVSSPVYASVSGKVKRLEERVASSGQFVTAVVIASDEQQTPYAGLTPPTVTDKESFLAAVRDSGVVGLGGAGFPTAVKLSLKDPSQLENLIINCAECEPFITSDTRTMLDNSSEMWEGLELIQHYMAPPRVIFGIENNKPQCIKLLQNLAKGSSNVEIKVLPALYPQGGEKVLIFHCTGRIVPEGKLPIDAGAVVLNCTTLAAIAHYIKTGMPLVEKCITVDGSAVATPQNVIAPIGTPLRELFQFCGGFKEKPYKILYGGPMMGISVPSLDEPVLKSTNAALAFNQKDATPPPETPCIRCGRCAAHCPLRLMPADIEKAFDRGDTDTLAALKVNLCMECGCCSFVCPAKRPLVQVNKLAKQLLKNRQGGMGK